MAAVVEVALSPPRLMAPVKFFHSFLRKNHTGKAFNSNEICSAWVANKVFVLRRCEVPFHCNTPDTTLMLHSFFALQSPNLVCCVHIENSTEVNSEFI